MSTPILKNSSIINNNTEVLTETLKIRPLVMLHQKALQVSENYLKNEALLIGIFQEMDETKAFYHYQRPSLFSYAVRTLKLSEPVALTLIGIARKSKTIPELKKALEERKITLSNAKRITPILTPENKAEWIEKAGTHTLQQLDYELAKQFPRQPKPTKIRFLSEDLARLETDLSVQAIEHLKRAQEILSQNIGAHVNLSQTLETVLADFIERHDPLKKAERAEIRSKATSAEVKKNMEKLHVLKNACASKTPKRVPIPAVLKHAITRRDQSQCSFVDLDGSRCGSRKWLDIHHIRPISKGGKNEIDNLKTLCRAHHRQTHFIYEDTRITQNNAHDRTLNSMRSLKL